MEEEDDDTFKYRNKDSEGHMQWTQQYSRLEWQSLLDLLDSLPLDDEDDDDGGLVGEGVVAIVRITRTVVDIRVQCINFVY